MEKNITYSEVAELEYIFSKQEILEALIEKFDISFKDVVGHEFDIYEEYYDSKYDANEKHEERAVLILKYKTPKNT